MQRIRTNQQNKALHKMFEQLAAELNDCGASLERTLKLNLEIPWSKELVKELIFRPVMKAQVMKNSTRELTTSEVNKIYETISRHLAQRLGIVINFPNIQDLMHDKER